MLVQCLAVLKLLLLVVNDSSPPITPANQTSSLNKNAWRA